MSTTTSSGSSALTNWAGTHVYGAARVHQPASLDDLAAVIAGAERVHALGSRHSFNAVADTDGDLVSTASLSRDIDIDAERGSVRVAGGVLYGELAEALATAGWALASMASLPHISVAGAVATGTHGSGDGLGSLSTVVSRLEYLDATGSTRVVSRGEPDFDGTVVALGALGVVTHVTLDLEPAYDVRQVVHRGLPWSALAEDLRAITSSAYSVSVFTDWVDERATQVWRKSRDDDRPDPELFGATAATEPLHMLPGGEVEALTPQGGAWGSWHERLPHFRMGFTPSRGEEIQSEYLVAREHAAEAIAVLRDLGPRISPVLQVSEIRTVAGDGLWLSEAYGSDRVCFHFTWHRDRDGVRTACTQIEERLLPLGARPHWGKWFGLGSRELASLYPRLEDFQELRRRVDPGAKFGNAYLDRVIGPSRSAGRQ
jgi:xylitol oxidase